MQVTNFSGIVPREPDFSQSVNMAQKAMDVDLTRGTLRPWRERQVAFPATQTAKTFHVYGCCPFVWDECVTVAEWLPSCPRLYVTGRKPYPEVATLNECSLTYTRLGVPMPAYAPVVSYVTVPTKSRDSELRAYVVTYVNHLGEESAPSFPSTELAIDDGDPVSVSGWGKPATEYNVTHVRIYRRGTAYRQGTEKEQIIETVWLLVGEIPISQQVYVDRMLNLDAGRVLETRECRPAPEGLQQITAIAGTAVLCGFKDNTVYFSKNHQPWNWPLELEVTLDDNIVHIQESGGKIFVSTTGMPYIIDATVDCGDRPVRAVVMGDYPYPDIACAMPRGSCATPFGMVYPSADGLVLLSESGVTFLTKTLFTKDGWREIKPETAVISYYKGHIIFATDMATLMLLIDGEKYKTGAVLTTISDQPIDMQLSRNGELLMLIDGAIYQWDSADTYRPYVWKSITFDSLTPVWVTTARIFTQGSVMFTFVSGLRQVYNRSVFGDKSFRLPRQGRHRQFSIEMTGVDEVYYIELSVTNTEVR